MASNKSLKHDYFFFFNDTATTEIYTLSLHDALPIYRVRCDRSRRRPRLGLHRPGKMRRPDPHTRDRKSTRLNSSHLVISYAVFCLKKKKKSRNNTQRPSIQPKPLCLDTSSRRNIINL